MLIEFTITHTSVHAQVLQLLVLPIVPDRWRTWFPPQFPLNQGGDPHSLSMKKDITIGLYLSQKYLSFSIKRNFINASIACSSFGDPLQLLGSYTHRIIMIFGLPAFLTIFTSNTTCHQIHHDNILSGQTASQLIVQTSMFSSFIVKQNSTSCSFTK